MGDERKARPFVLQWRSAVLNSAEPASVKLTLLALAEFADAQGKRAIPGTDLLAKLTTQSERTCRRSLDQADGRWFSRVQVKLSGKDWRAYEYALVIPEGADTVTAPRREGADTVTARSEASCGHSDPKVRTLTPDAADTVSTVLGRASRKASRGRLPETTFDQWMQTFGPDDDCIPENHAVFRYAERVGIPTDFLDLAWHGFMRKYQGDTKRRYRDWPAVFKRAVEEDWLKIWRLDNATGAYYLTTAGQQLRRLLDAPDHARAA